ncbi:ferritin-like domain-containing protein [Marinicauda algicola]|uniref:ferritin-like domain-containing protein n=1 Tax=Marinicauda algicola TaxID=2029849 RepID=UPI001F12E87C|nr:ferritin-like domain-containing protein [Marinicauda algicola]
MSAPERQDVRAAALGVLNTSGPAAKAGEALRVAEAWRRGALALPSSCPLDLPERPARPARPELVPPGQVPRRRLNGQAGRFALMHAVAHIEFNAIDLAFDMVARFSGASDFDTLDRRTFVSDWIGVGEDEARHFEMIEQRLAELGGAYGDLPAHDGLWGAATATSDDVLARLAIAPLVLEARGLDVTPGMIEKLKSAGDRESAARLEVIYREEIGHVAAGARWFERVCGVRGLDRVKTFHRMVETRFKGGLKRPFNAKARERAGLYPDFYEPIAP